MTLLLAIQRRIPSTTKVERTCGNPRPFWTSTSRLPKHRLLQGLSCRPPRIEYGDGLRARTEEDQHAHLKLSAEEDQNVYLKQHLAVTTALKQLMSVDALPRS